MRTAAVGQASGGAVVVPGLEGSAKIKGSDSTWGYDIGLLFTPFDGTRIGLSYRSSLKYTLNGRATFVAPSTASVPATAVIAGLSNSSVAGAPTNGPVKLDLELPSSARLAVAQKLGNAFELLGEVSWTQWNTIPELKIVRPGGGVLKNTQEHWQNAMRYALGANWQVTDAVKLRIGAAVDQTLIGNDADRTARLPDNDRTWASLGAKFKLTDNINLDVGYMHVFVKDADISQTDGQAFSVPFNAYPNGKLVGTQQTKIDILGLQGTVTF